MPVAAKSPKVADLMCEEGGTLGGICLLAFSAALVNGNVQAKAAAKTKLTRPHNLLAPPNIFDNGSIQRDMHPNVAAVNSSPSAPVLTPMSYNLICPAFPCKTIHEHNTVNLLVRLMNLLL